MKPFWFFSRALFPVSITHFLLFMIDLNIGNVNGIFQRVERVGQEVFAFLDGVQQIM